MISGQETQQAHFLKPRSPNGHHDLEPVTLILDLDLDILKMYLPIINDVSRSRLSKVRARTGQTDRQTDRRDQRHYQVTLAGGNNSTIYQFVTYQTNYPSRLQQNLRSAMKRLSLFDTKCTKDFRHTAHTRKKWTKNSEYVACDSEKQATMTAHTLSNIISAALLRLQQEIHQEMRYPNVT